jgi:hypothetical protein
MAKRILLDILVKVLGEYIELDAENFDLSLAVWSGHIALKNLKVSDIKRDFQNHYVVICSSI